MEAVVLFVKYPTPGRVKTRLAVGVGPDRATWFYKHCAEHVIKQCARLEDKICKLYVSCEEEVPKVGQWLQEIQVSLDVRAQVSSSCLGERMHVAMARCFEEGAKKVVIVGSDIPDVTDAILRRALAALDHHEVAFGPAVDGGFYLLGLTALPPALFEGIEWSTSTVLAATTANAQRLQLSVAPLDTLPTLQDIDTLQDLQTWFAQQIPTATSAAPGPARSSADDDLISSACVEEPHPIAAVVNAILEEVQQ